VPPRFNPVLKEGPVTQAAPYNPKRPPLSAAAAMTWSLRDLMPQVQLEGTLGEIERPWSAKRDLLGSAPNAHEFVVEVESDGSASLRFGDDEYGLRPAPGTQFAATYRVGNGTRGNIGAESLGHIVSSDSGIAGVSNPMPAAGGLEPEPIEQVKQEAPSAFRVQERAVTADDYAGVAERHPDVLKAVATIRWTGSWQTVFISVDRLGGRAVDHAFKEDVISFLDRYRMAGQDVEIEGPVEVPLEIEISVCVNADYFRSDVEGDLLKVFSNTTHPDGSRGFFHPDNFTFGQPVYLSAIYAAAQAVQGVNFVEVTTFQRLGVPDDAPLAAGVLTMERLEIARLNNDPNFPERGVLRLVMKGGR
jgi:predicted phage baseplate assembly protein